MISFYFEDVSEFPLSRLKVRKWLKSVVELEGKKVGELSIVFCSDEYLLKMNNDYLKHDYFTDVITFDYNVGGNVISGDIFISIDRVKENANTLKVSFSDELHRIIVHGVLHLLGYSDKSRAERVAMEEKENYYLPLLV
ncbi:MAG TPA: rRNA maturation RNase YbeY [Bacteroidales bacterium]|nr:rRNA maturation RNase YbeY [Bacteroidales bacterium]